MDRRRQEGKERKTDNRGSAMVMLIIAIALVSILVAVIMVMSTLNLQMKYTERKAKRNFYMAEVAMEQIRAGLELEVSKAAQKAYESIQQSYAPLTPDERAVNFQTLYALTLREALQGTDLTGKTYDLSMLTGFIDPNQFKIAGSDANTEVVSTKACKMDAPVDGLILYGVKLTYTDDEGFQSMVETDFRLLIPKLRFIQFSVMPDLFGYSLVADQGIESTKNNKETPVGSDVTFEDNVYAGSGGIRKNEVTTQAGILISGASANWTFKNMDRLVCKGTVQVENSARLSMKSNNEFTVNLWAKDILVDGSKASLDGRTYVKDDLALRGKGSEVTLSEEYYGFGNGTELDVNNDSFIYSKKNASAMLINGLNSTLNMKKLDQLLLSGRASVATGGTEVQKPEQGDADLELPGVTIDNQDISMGESIGIKSNQIAYLVPAECIGVQNGEALIGRNPMSAADYIQLVKYRDDPVAWPGFAEVSLQTQVKKLGKPLNDYAAGGNLEYRRIFQQVGGEIVVYYYLLLDKENSARYFKDYYEAEKERLDRYMKQYTNGLFINDTLSRLVLGGSIVTYDGENITLQENNKVLTPAQENGLNEEIQSYYKVFAALNAKLLPTYGDLTKDEKTRTVFENLIDSSKLPGTAKNYSLDVEGGSRTLQAYVTAGNFHFPGDMANPGNKQNVSLILAGGDVTVSEDFSGLILAGGKILLQDNKKLHIKGNREDLVKILQAPADPTVPTGNTVLQEYFKDGSEYVLDGTSIKKPEEDTGKDASASVETYLDLTDYVQYENWKKE